MRIKHQTDPTAVSAVLFYSMHTRNTETRVLQCAGKVGNGWTSLITPRTELRYACIRKLVPCLHGMTWHSRDS